MTRRHAIAVAVGLATILVALFPPLWIRSTGDEVTLVLRPVDPLSLFRGNYVDLTYDLGDPSQFLELDDNVDPESEAAFVVFDDARPANVVRITTDIPDLADGETCIRSRRNRIRFPELEQYFVPKDQAVELERNLDQMVGVIRTTGSCRAILVSVEPR